MQKSVKKWKWFEVLGKRIHNGNMDFHFIAQNRWKNHLFGRYDSVQSLNTETMDMYGLWTSKRSLTCLLDVLCIFDLRPVSRCMAAF